MFDFIYYQARDVMATNPITIDPDSTVSDAQAIFENHDFNGLPVIDEDGLLTGMITKLDVLRAFVFSEHFKVPPYHILMKKHVFEVMTRAIESVEPDTPLTRVLTRMISTRHKSFPVVENGRLVGIVAREDILGALRRAAQGEKPARLEQT
ncbi:MAG: CBS domain-containing protein [Pseudomonadota bacterium]